MLIFGGRDDVIAQWLSKDFIHKHSGFLKQAVIGPGEYAVVIRNGKIVDIVSQKKLKRMGGLWQGILRKLGGGEDIQLLVVDTRPKRVSIPFRGWSKDRIRVSGSLDLTLRISPDNIAGIMKIMSGVTILDWKGGERVVIRQLTLSELTEKIRPDVQSVIYTRILSKRSARDFHENTEMILEDLQGVVRSLAFSWGDYGLELVSYTILIGENRYEEVMRKAAETELLEKERDIEFFEMVGEAKRAEELRREKAKFEQETKLLFEEQGFELRKVKLDHEMELKRKEGSFSREEKLAEVEHDELIRGKRVEGQVDRLKLQKDAEIYMRSRDLDLEDLGERKRIEREKLEAQHDLEVLSALTEIHKKVKENKVMEFQGTKLEELKVYADVEKDKARWEAEKEKYSLDTYERAIEKERQYALEREKIEAEKLKAVKTVLPSTYVQGTPVGANINIPSGAGTRTCPNCGRRIPAEALYCPYCGSSFSSENSE